MDYNSSISYTFFTYEWVGYETSEPISIIAIIFFALVIIFGTTGNILVVLAFCMNPPLRSHSINVYMVQTSIVNLIVSAIINPIYITTIFIDFHDEKKTFAIDYANLAVMHLANTLSMYSLCAVATNRYLLIARPKTTFQIWCVPRRRITGVLAGLWLAAILTSFPYWAFLYYDLYAFIDSKKSFERLTIAGYVLNAMWFLPVIIVPIMHLATLRVIKSSRMRIEGQRNDFILNAEQVRQQSNGLQGPTVSTDGNDDTESSEKRDTGTGNDGTTDLEGATTNNAELADGAPGAAVTTCCCKTQGSLNVQPRRNRGLAESEMRLIKMMFLMYTILVISLVPAILSFTSIIHLGPLRYLGLFGFFIPIYPAAMPFLFLWSNNNFRSAAAKVIQGIRRHVRRRVEPH